MKPGKPLTFATIDLPPGEGGAAGRRMLVFGLPGARAACPSRLQSRSTPRTRTLPALSLRFSHPRTKTPLGTLPQNPLTLPPPPGNPVSSFVCFSLVAVPVLRKMGGWPEPGLRRIHVTLTAGVRLDPERPEYHRATLQYGPPPGSAAGAELRRLEGPTSSVDSIAVSPDDVLLATGSGDSTARLWDALTGGALQTLAAAVRFA